MLLTAVHIDDNEVTNDSVISQNQKKIWIYDRKLQDYATISVYTPTKNNVTYVV